jgi:hypothetical protein
VEVIKMQGSMRAPAQLLFRSGLVIFLVTIVIGILNGIDVWQPSRELLLTHVHAGTLGWITLGVVGLALVMFGGDGDTDSGMKVAQAMVGATVLYLLAFATTTGVLRPIAGTLMLAAIVNAFVWITKRRANAPRTVVSLAMYLGMVSLVLGAVLGVLLGLFIANGYLRGMSTKMVGNLAGAHPPAMLAGYLLLVGFAIAEWRLSPEAASVGESRTGVATAWGLFAAGLFFNIALIFDVEPLIQLASMLQVIAVVVFVVRMWAHLKPAAWREGGINTFARWSVVYLVVGIGLLVYIVQLFVSGQLDPESGEGTHILIAFDHALFVGLMTNVLLAATGDHLRWDGVQRSVAWALNIGVAGFIIGLVAESSAIKRVFTPILGLALLVVIYTHMMRAPEPVSS